MVRKTNKCHHVDTSIVCLFVYRDLFHWLWRILDNDNEKKTNWYSDNYVTTKESWTLNMVSRTDYDIYSFNS